METQALKAAKEAADAKIQAFYAEHLFEAKARAALQASAAVEDATAELKRWGAAMLAATSMQGTSIHSNDLPMILTLFRTKCSCWSLL